MDGEMTFVTRSGVSQQTRPFFSLPFKCIARSSSPALVKLCERGLAFTASPKRMEALCVVVYPDSSNPSLRANTLSNSPRPPF